MVKSNVTSSSRIVKDPVRAASTVPLVLSGAQTVDTVALVANDRCLVKDQADAKTNGIYLVHAGAWVRAGDANSSSLLVPDMVVLVSEGSQAETEWLLAADAPVVLGTSNLFFAQVSAAMSGVASLSFTAPLKNTGTAQNPIADANYNVANGALQLDAGGLAPFAQLPVGNGFPGDVTDTEVAGATSVQWALALISRVHMDADVAGFPAALGGGALQADLVAAVNALRAPLHSHLVEVGAPDATGSHWHSDTTNDAVQAAVVDATDTASAITLLEAYRAAYNAHNTQSQVHFHDDTTAPLVFVPEPPVLLADAITAYNAMRTRAISHGSKIGLALASLPLSQAGTGAYTPGTPGDWAGSPTTLQQALDRIAHQLAVLGAAPIP